MRECGCGVKWMGVFWARELGGTKLRRVLSATLRSELGEEMGMGDSPH